MKTVTTIVAVRRHVALQRDKGKVIGLVPTMGYLHQGHLSLVSIARRRSDYVVVSVYVNPKQFGPREDFSSYPRDLERDLDLLRKAGTDLVFHPSDREIYPHDHQTFVRVKTLGQTLCGRSRPHHFEGVTTIVMKLFNIVEPDIAVFGEKDFQQALIIKRMVKDLHCPVKIITGRTIREKDGLAMSSRNTYLTPGQRRNAPILYQTLRWARRRFAAGVRSPQRVLATMVERIRKKGGHIDYVTAVEPDTLQPVERLQKGTLIALAVYFGKTRLIDNTLL